MTDSLTFSNGGTAMETPSVSGENKLRTMVEIFTSVKGEGTQAGIPMTFCRFSKCNLACSWCDTPYNRTAFRATDEQLFDLLMATEPAWVVFTGGEPALQLSVWLCQALQEKGVKLAIESNGTMWCEALLFIDYVCFSPKTTYDGKDIIPAEKRIHPKIIEAVRAQRLTITEIRYVVESDQVEPAIVEVPSTFISFSPMMLDSDPTENFESGQGYRGRWGKVESKSYNACMKLVHKYRHRGARLSVQLHKFIGVR